MDATLFENTGTGNIDMAAHRVVQQERARLSPLAHIIMSGGGDLHLEDKPLSIRQKFKRWMVNEGYKYLAISVFVLLHLMIFVFGLMNYQLKDNLTTARATFGLSYAVARAAALVLHVDIALLLFPVCRTLISLFRQTPLNGIIPFDANISFHKLVAYSLCLFTLVHTVAHWNNFAQLSAKTNGGFKGFLELNFTTGPGWTGYLMLAILIAISVTSIAKYRTKNYERFWYTHHLFVLFFLLWSVHGAYCMIRPDSGSCGGTGVFYQFWLAGGFLYLGERIMREVRGRQRTFITKVIEHPSSVIEIQIKKDRIKTRAGQYIFLACPEVSLYQFHPFTLTSAPEEDYISVHIRCVGDFTKKLAQILGCGKKELDGASIKDPKGYKERQSRVVGVSKNMDTLGVDPAIRRTLPRVYIDGPFGSASEDVFKYEVAILIGAGIGVTPFASILKSIWYRMNYPKEKTRLRKVYFFWICRDFGSFEWFRSLLMAIEAQDMENHIEIHSYITAKIQADDATNIMINDAGALKDAITGLRAPTNFGRPNWDVIFRGIRKIHKPCDAGVFYCGPPALGTQLNEKCNTHSDPDCRFIWGKENF